MRKVPANAFSAQMQPLAEWSAIMLDAAEETAKAIGCSPAAIVAQAALESGWGRAAIGHNLFGIKADSSWTGARQLVRTREVFGGKTVFIDAFFRDYASFADSIADHFKFLSGNARYKAVFDPDNSKSDRDYFQAMKDAGYATDPEYVNLLVGVLQTVTRFEAKMTKDAATGTGTGTGTGNPAAAQPAPAPLPKPPRERLLLQIGGPSGGDVEELQRKLGIEADGEFGPNTRAAVEKFQSKHGLEPDGVVGPKTWEELDKI
jgi:hypothetical protein